MPVVAALLTVACAAPAPKPAQEQVVAWKNLGEWSGRGNAQTESFIGLTGSSVILAQQQREFKSGIVWPEPAVVTPN